MNKPAFEEKPTFECDCCGKTREGTLEPIWDAPNHLAAKPPSGFRNVGSRQVITKDDDGKRWQHTETVYLCSECP